MCVGTVTFAKVLLATWTEKSGIYSPSAFLKKGWEILTDHLCHGSSGLNM